MVHILFPLYYHLPYSLSHYTLSLLHSVISLALIPPSLYLFYTTLNTLITHKTYTLLNLLLICLMFPLCVKVLIFVSQTVQMVMLPLYYFSLLLLTSSILWILTTYLSFFLNVFPFPLFLIFLSF